LASTSTNSLDVEATHVWAAAVPTRSLIVSSRLLFLIVLVNLLRLTALAVEPGGLCAGCCVVVRPMPVYSVRVQPVPTSRLFTILSSFETLWPWASASPALGQCVACREDSRKSLGTMECWTHSCFSNTPTFVCRLFVPRLFEVFSSFRAPGSAFQWFRTEQR